MRKESVVLEIALFVTLFTSVAMVVVMVVRGSLRQPEVCQCQAATNSDYGSTPPASQPASRPIPASQPNKPRVSKAVDRGHSSAPSPAQRLILPRGIALWVL